KCGQRDQQEDGPDRRPVAPLRLSHVVRRVLAEKPSASIVPEQLRHNVEAKPGDEHDQAARVKPRQAHGRKTRAKATIGRAPRPAAAWTYSGLIPRMTE